jgi:hypothetical protein
MTRFWGLTSQGELPSEKLVHERSWTTENANSLLWRNSIPLYGFEVILEAGTLTTNVQG